MFNKIFSKKKEEEPKIEEFTEVPQEEEGKKVNIMIEKLEGLVDTDPIIKKVKEGNIVLAHIKNLRENNMEELKQSIGKIRTYTANMKGDVVGVGDEWLVVAPPSVEIKRN
ncbi:MAG: cell division protein SepF [Candidatus Aenigmarchaeota archaeon]|nr:cell division protein SepF [Candidatus Aenigmarchaeota archaeon]